MSLFPARRRRAPRFDAILAPEQPFYAIGDVHGRADKLRETLRIIDDADPDATIITVGDLIDRGPASAQVLRLLRARCQERPGKMVCLMGNHESMCLKFLDSPHGRSASWLRHGGLETLASFGLAHRADTSPAQTAQALRDAMGPDLLAWMTAAPAWWQSGNVAVVHAGADPALSVSAQPVKTLIWGHPDFTRQPRQDGVWVLHGHTVVDSPIVDQGRIAIDTGAYATDRLTTARVSAEGLSFLTV